MDSVVPKKFKPESKGTEMPAIEISHAELDFEDYVTVKKSKTPNEVDQDYEKSKFVASS